MEPYPEGQNKAFPKGNLRLLVVLFRITPLLGIAGLAVGLGHRLGIRIPEVGGIYHLIITWGLFIGLLMLPRGEGMESGITFWSSHIGRNALIRIKS